MNQRTDSKTRSNNRRTLRIRPPLMIGSPAAMGRDRRQGIIRSPTNQEYNEPRSSEMVSSSPIPPSPFESNERMNKRGPHFKQTKGGDRYHHTVRRPLGYRRTVQNENISLDEWIWRNGLQIYKGRIKDFVSNMTELLELDPPEVEKMAPVCDMGFAFRQRTVRAHYRPRVTNMDRIRRATEGALNEETARK